jgi:hypothetical protein
MRSSVSRSVSRLALRATGACGLVASVGVLGAGCLTRPVEPGSPSLKTNFTQEVKQQAVDKIDLLFMIDNSASMGDKQELLSEAVPDLMSRLITPNCVDAQGNPIQGPNGPLTTTTGDCTQGKAEFQPVHDMHIGIVSSSLGGMGSDACPDNAPNPVNGALNSHNNDHGHLIARAGDNETTPAPGADQGSGSLFLAWFPASDPKNQGHVPPHQGIADPTALNGDFQQMVIGVHQYGCGYEAQLESWYRFLIQPDPYQSVSAPDPNTGQVKLQGIDQTILQQRHDFLRPDSLVAVVVLTDENEETPDPLSLGGQGWAYLNSNFPGSTTGGGAAKGTSQCAQNPEDTNCTSCGFCNQKTGQPASVCQDPICAASDKGYYTPQQDSLNNRGYHQKQRFGVDPQFPITRYVNGLTSHKVPDQKGEHPADSNGNPSPNYVGNNDCVNPLYATNLPTQASQELCKLTPGPRTPDLVYFAAVTGVPWQLLLQNPAPPYTGAFKTSFADSDWNLLMGQDPLHYNFTGVDPHMLESDQKRQGIGNPDPIVGHDYTTNGADLEYACTFPLATPRDCTQTVNKFACDCENGSDSPLCDPANPNSQIRGKAYPSLRELALVRAMKDQGIVSSLCPRTDQNGNLLPNTDPDYGYRPAVRAIIDRLKNSLANQCLPQPLTADQTGQVPCLVLLTLTNANSADESICTQRGFLIPDPDILAKFQSDQHSAWLAAGGSQSGTPDPAQEPVCQLQQIVKKAGDTCANDSGAGWCYVVNGNGQTPAGGCPQAILFTAQGNPTGAKISLQCIEANTVQDGGPGSAPATGSE